MARFMNYNPLIALLLPVILAIGFTYYSRANHQNRLEELAENGVLAIYRGGQVTQNDFMEYIRRPPTEDSSILRALELTPEDVIGLEREDPAFFDTENGQLLIKRIIKHIALVRNLLNRYGHHPPTGLEQDIARYRESLLRTTMELELANYVPRVTQEEMLAYYIRNPLDFHREGRRLARHLMITSGPAADLTDGESLTPDEALRRLNEGEDFSNLIAFSESVSVNNGGMLGWLTRGMAAQPFEAVLWALEIGEVTGPVQVGGASHFIQLLDEEQDGLIPFEDCVEEIASILRDEKSLRRQYEILNLNIDNRDAVTRWEYETALLRTALDRGLDQDRELLAKLDAYAAYREADLHFLQFVNVINQERRSRDELESTWLRENSAAMRILERMRFQLTVDLNTPEHNAPRTLTYF